MKHRLTVSLTLLLLFYHFVASANEVIIERVTVLSSHLNEPLPNRYVHIVDDRIVAITTQPPAPLTANPISVSGKGKFLTYGLMDSHVHVGSVPGIGFIDSDLAKKKARLVSEYLTQQPRSYLYFGVTQVLNLGSSNGRAAFTQAQWHPNFFTCQPIPVVGGYPHTDATYTVNNAAYFIIEPDMNVTIPDHIDPANHTPEAVVARIADTDTKCIKMFFEDGFGGASHWPLLRDNTVARVRKAANKYQLQLIAHANAIDMYQVALDHNIDVLAHGMWNWQWPEEKGQAPVAETLEKVMQNKVAYMPTIQVIQALQGMYDDDFLANPLRKKALPQPLLDWYQTAEGRWFEETIREDFGGDMSDGKMHEVIGFILERATQSTQFLAEHNYPLLLASDFPSSPSHAAAPGLSTYHELLNLANAGLSTKAIFDTATLQGPKQFGIENDFGTVEVGKVANLLLLNANPLAHIEAWQSIDFIILRGELISREALSAN